MSDAASLLRQLETQFAAAKPDLAQCEQLAMQFKIALLQLPITPPVDLSNAQVRSSLELARSGLEICLLLSLHRSDLKAFERNFAQIHAYYFDYASALSESKRRWQILGLHLLGLLAQSRISEFHTELERLPAESHHNECIAYAMAMEQELMEGSYRSLWDASAKLPCNEYRFFVDPLVAAARDSIADCIEKAYRELSIDDAAKLLKLTNATELQAFCSKRQWTIEGQQVRFLPQEHKSLDIPAHSLMKQSLEYAVDLERII